MKKLILILALFSGITTVQAQRASAVDQWRPMLDKPQLAEYFSGIFEHLGIRVMETEETFTVHNLGNHFEITEGIDPDQVDYILVLSEELVERMVKHGQDSEIDATESFLIMGIMFTPLTQASLNNPFLTKKRNLRVGGVEKLIHVVLLDPAKKEDYAHTLIFVEGQWLVVPGRHGNADRTFKLTPEQAAEYQRKLFEARQQNTAKAWKNFAKWYRTWRLDVSV